jgi:hypothetical protein
MPGATPTHALAAARWQLRRVRWRSNRLTLTRLVLRLVAIGAAAAALLLALAIEAGTRTFIAGAVMVVAAVAGAGFAVGRRAARGWLGTARAHLAVDRQADLRGRLATLLEMEGSAEAAFFLPLLSAQNLERLPTWEPRRLVPRVLPRGDAASALAATAVLAIAIALAPRLAPSSPPEAEPPRGLVVAGSVDGPHGVLARAGPSASSTAAGLGRDAGAADGDAATAKRRSRLDRLADELQARIRDGLWGEGWRQAAEATARAESERGSDGQGGDAESGSLDEPSWEEARPTRGGGERRRSQREASAPPAASASRDPSGTGPRAGGARGATDETRSGQGEGAPGAGSGTSPGLYGAATEADHKSGAPFSLGITARMRAVLTASRRPSGDAPPAAPDAGPHLALGQEDEAPASRVSIPPGYESIVRRVFARGTPQEGPP